MTQHSLFDAEHTRKAESSSGNAPAMPVVTVYCDGASKGNPGAGGWGAVVQCSSGGWSRDLCGGQANVTNNQMELMAAIKALESLESPSLVTVFTDSQYVCKGMSEWIAGWKRKGWVNAAKEPVKNKELWVALDGQCARHRVQWKWVKGHAGHPGNERADALANEGVRKA